MTLTKKQFDIMTHLAENKNEVSQRAIAKATNMSVGTVNKTLTELRDMELISDTTITEKGWQTLENYRVKRAIFIAAGFGSRLAPITFNTPKPLVRVKGKRIIDSLLDAVTEAGIEEIYLVRGYLWEQFDQLLYKYPNNKFINNPIYNETNNISSVHVARDLIRNAYVLEGDLLLYNPKLIKKYQYSTNYLGVPVEKTDDWCFYTDNNLKIVKMAIGGTDCHHMFGISYWTEKDGEQLAKDVEKVFNSPGGKERYWDQVALEYYMDNYSIACRPCTFDDITEIDTFNELKAIDSTYKM